MLSFVVVFVIVIYQFQFLVPTWPRILWAVWRRVSHWHPYHPPTTPTTLYQAVMPFLSIELSLKAWSLHLQTSLYLLTIISGLQAVIVETLGPDQPHRFHTIWVNCMVSCMFSIFFGCLFFVCSSINNVVHFILVIIHTKFVQSPCFHSSMGNKVIFCQF